MIVYVRLGVLVRCVLFAVLLTIAIVSA